MYKRFAAIIILIIVIGTLTASLSVYFSNENNWVIYRQDFVEQKQALLSHYILSTQTSLRNNIDYYNESDDLISATLNKETRWFEEVFYPTMLLQQTNSADYVIVSDALGEFYWSNDSRFDEQFLTSYLFGKTLSDKETEHNITLIDNRHALVVTGPIQLDRTHQTTGLMAMVKFLDQANLEEYQQFLGTDLMRFKFIHRNEIDPLEEVISPSITVQGEVASSVYIIEMVYDNVKLYNVFYSQRNQAIYIIFISAASVGVAILVFLFIVVKRLSEITNVVTGIAAGDYSNKVATSRRLSLHEMDNLSKAINRMSDDIQSHLSTIDQNYLEMVDVIINAVEINDAYTSSHNIEVGNYAKLIAEEIQFKRIDDIVLAARLHDIGKISISGEILNKPGRLTDEEYEVIKTHPTEGYKIIESIDYFNHIKLGVKYHHEHWDGTGYPEGLKEEEIPLIAQIIAVADVYDAVTSDRSYRRALSHEEGKKVIINGSGNLFNPLLVEAFMNRLDDFERVNKESKLRR